MYVFLQLEYDVLEYVVIERLAQGGRDKLKDDGLNLSDWLQSLASFWGHLYVSVFLQDLVVAYYLSYPPRHVNIGNFSLSCICLYAYVLFPCLLFSFLYYFENLFKILYAYYEFSIMGS